MIHTLLDNLITSIVAFIRIEQGKYFREQVIMLDVGRKIEQSLF